MPGKLQPFLQTVIIAGLEDAKGKTKTKQGAVALVQNVEKWLKVHKR